MNSYWKAKYKATETECDKLRSKVATHVMVEENTDILMDRMKVEVIRLRNIERHWLAIAVRDPEPRLRKAIQTIDELQTKLTEMENE